MLTDSSLWNGRKIKHILDNGPSKLVIMDPKLQGRSEIVKTDNRHERS